ncbi:fimbria major subunit [Prevotella sp. Sow4_E9_plate]|uniref:fimbria major subunit n=1 Tax=Prevotella sp. Sow4_E9_plate TaxID=3438802 RepID=UPI003F9707A4
MKKMNLLVMSLVSAAAFSFSSCSSNDDLTGGAGNQSKVEGFYMTLAVQTPTSNGTRTQQQKENVKATPEESKVTSGTFYLVDAQGKIVFTKNITETEWLNAAPVLTKTGTTQIQVPVQNVTEGVTYNVYFLANTTDAMPWENIFAPTAEKFTAINMFDAGYATDNAFVMFNQNDKNSHADQYIVSFEAANKNIKTPASVNKTIMLDRVTARIDKPETEATSITAKYPEGASDTKKAAIDAEIAKVKTVTQSNYAITNLSNKTNIMQKWNDAWAALQIPAGTDHMQKSGDLGDQWTLENYGWFANAEKNYVFENTKETPTTMYFEYTLGLDESKFPDDTPDFTDGTFYRYNGVIYRSIAAIYKAYQDQPILFGGKSAADLLAELKPQTEGEGENVKKTIGATAAELAKFRKDNVIEVFVAGKTYYSQVIIDKWLGTNTIQRNTVYQLNVKKIYNLGADVPNGKPDENKPMYYLDVEVSVNPWVLSTQDVNLGE